MENVTEALKLVLGIMVFLIAFTVLFQTASLARYTSEILITERDKTTYYSYYKSEDYPVKENENISGMVNRIVTLEEMIPTIYRYSTESYGVTIIDNNKIVARFDMQTETLCNGWNSTNDSQKRVLIDRTNTYILKPIGVPENSLLDRNKPQEELEKLFLDIYKQNRNNMYLQEFNCPWLRSDKDISQRIDSDLSRNTSSI